MSLTPSEQRLIDCVGHGRVADFSAAAESKPTQGYAWGPERTIRCEVIKALVTGASECRVGAVGIVIKGARIAGQLDLRDAELGFPFALCACFIDRPLILENASALSIRLTASCINGLSASGLSIARDLFLDELTATSQVQIARAKVGGILSCADACLTNRDAIALDADRVAVTGSLILRGAQIRGEVILAGARIGSDLECTGASLDNRAGRALRADRARVAGGVFLCDGFSARGEVSLAGSGIGGDLTCINAAFENHGRVALCADSAHVAGAIELRGVAANGEVRLTGARLGRDLMCESSRLDNPASSAIAAQRIAVGGSVFLGPRLLTRGTVDLAGAEIGAGLDCAGASFEAFGRTDSIDGPHEARAAALIADRVTVRGTLRLEPDFSAHGAVRLTAAEIGGDLSCAGASFENPGGPCFSIERAAIAGDLTLPGPARPPIGILNLAHARAGRFLIGPPQSWPAPGCLVLDGFKYDRVAAGPPPERSQRLSARDCLAWLERQGDRYAPQPFDELIRALTAAGHERQSREIAIAKRKALLRKGNLPWWSRAWIALLGATVGYGYRPWLAALWLGGFIIAGAQIFGYAQRSGVIVQSQSWVYRDGWYEAHRTAARLEAYPPFDPYLFSTDALVPFVDLHQKAFWWPNARGPGDRAYIACETYLVAHELAGWTLLALMLAALGGLLRKD
ncbi:MAG TPA: hypothetical protein VEC38_10290 [Candidatus Binataceae bacterium]|nr:hypothetical protein [Candidatus Binataceae bacterium]